jgi:lipoate-protein ligase A
VRRFGAVAYVGRLYRTFDPLEQSACLAGEVALRAGRATQLAAATTDLAALARPGALDQFPAALVAAVGACQGVIPAPGALTDAERARAARLTAERYARDEWTLRI